MKKYDVRATEENPAYNESAACFWIGFVIVICSLIGFASFFF